MKRLTISILVFITYLVSYGQVKVNPNGKFFDYNGTQIYYEDTANFFDYYKKDFVFESPFNAHAMHAGMQNLRKAWIRV